MKDHHHHHEVTVKLRESYSVPILTKYNPNIKPEAKKIEDLFRE